jgi:aryl-alcohol dehydrogenase-like predicted oxidoreductase
MKRRDFIRTGTAGAITLSFADVLAMYDQINPGDIPTRILGRTGEKLSIVGFGGIALRNNGPEFAGELVPRAYHAGIKYFDVAPGYGDAQELMGPPLEPYRKDVFLACKTMMRDREGAERELAESLKLLRTDHFDLYQFHAMSSMDDVGKVFGRDGAMEAFLKARRDGKIRYIGFSAHNEEVALKMMDLFDFDSILYPINCVCWENGDFGPRVFRTAREKGMGVLALKAVAKTSVAEEKRPFPNMWYEPFGEDEEIEKALSFTLSKDITATVHAGDSLFQKKTLDFVKNHKSIEAPDEETLNAMIEGIEPIFSHPAV